MSAIRIGPGPYNLNNLRRYMANVEKQIHFAAAKALTKTALDAQFEVKRQLPERFIIRTPWVAKGIRIQPASKQKLQAKITVKDEFMALQETGGKKSSHTGRSLSVPVAARPTPRSITRPSKHPRELLKRPRFFIAPLEGSTGEDRMVVWQRRTRRRYPLKLWYIFNDNVDLDPKFDFKKTARGKVVETIHRNFADALQQALDTDHLFFR